MNKGSAIRKMQMNRLKDGRGREYQKGKRSLFVILSMRILNLNIIFKVILKGQRSGGIPLLL
ncbi:hypothetical protein ASG89_01675 [Paenibacillus sp. Soil766]|nr:hypothetical protein ASG89_01675 [Paenibacillus sp. Soil766]